MNAIYKLDAVILAGGLGTRLSGVITDRQKVTAEVSGRPFIAILLKQLESAGFRRVVICTGHLAATVEDAVKEHAGSLEVVFSEEKEPLGTGGALHNALDKIITPRVLAMNGDSYFGADLEAFIQQCETGNAILLRHEKDTARYGSVRVGNDHLVAEFREKDGSAGPGYINAGIYLLDKSAISAFPENRRFSLEKEVFPALAKNNKLMGIVADGLFIDIGTPESYEFANKLFTEQ